MSARSRLMGMQGAVCGDIGKIADEILNEHAHELAERIRSESVCPNEEDGMLTAANLIDPEA